MSLGGPSLYGIRDTGRVIGAFTNEEPFSSSEASRIISNSFIDVSSFRTLYVSVTTDINLSVIGLFSNDYGTHVSESAPQNVPASDGTQTTVIAYPVVGATANFSVNNTENVDSEIFTFSVYGSKDTTSGGGDGGGGMVGAFFERIPVLEWPFGSNSAFTTPIIDVSGYGSLTINSNVFPPASSPSTGTFGGVEVDFYDEDPNNPGSDLLVFSPNLTVNRSVTSGTYRRGGATASIPIMGPRCRIRYTPDSGNDFGSSVYGNFEAFVAPFPAGSLYP